MDVILPALNEAGALPWVLSRLPDGYRALVVDNGSTDGTAEIARAAGAWVISEPVRGFGAACFAGLSAAESELVCFMDADGSLDPMDLPLVAEPVAAGDAQLMLGSRQLTERGAMPPHARLANRMLARELRRRTGLPLTDLGPMRCAPRAQLLALELRDRRFGWPLEMVVRAHSAGWAIAERPVPYRSRTGRSKVTGTVRGTMRTVRDMTAALR